MIALSPRIAAPRENFVRYPMGHQDFIGLATRGYAVQNFARLTNPQFLYRIIFSSAQGVSNISSKIYRYASHLNSVPTEVGPRRLRHSCHADQGDVPYANPDSAA